jgi:hypothetical protein
MCSEVDLSGAAACTDKLRLSALARASHQCLGTSGHTQLITANIASATPQRRETKATAAIRLPPTMTVSPDAANLSMASARRINLSQYGQTHARVDEAYIIHTEQDCPK